MKTPNENEIKVTPPPGNGEQQTPTEQKPSYFDKLRSALVGQRRARRTFAKPR